MKRKIKKVAVLGAGIMGTGIAAHLANCHIPCFLLDIVPRDLTPEEKEKGLTTSSPAFRNRLSVSSLESAIKNRKPIPAFYQNSFADLITCGNLEDNLGWLKECDWIVEVVIENVDIKRKIFENRREVHEEGRDCLLEHLGNTDLGHDRRPVGRIQEELFGHALLQSGAVHEVVGDRSRSDHRPGDRQVHGRAWGPMCWARAWCTARTPATLSAIESACTGRCEPLKEMMDKDYTIEEVDAFVGEPMARPKTRHVPPERHGRSRHLGAHHRQLLHQPAKRRMPRSLQGACFHENHGR